MYRLLTALLAFVMISAGCSKDNDDTSHNDLKGVWRRESTNGQGPGNTLTFALVGNVPTLTFDCSGSPGPNWPTVATVPYKFQSGKLSYLNYYDNSQGYYPVSSFRWITEGAEFEVEFNQILLYLSSVTKVKYKKID